MKEVLILFNSEGGYLVPSEVDSTDTHSKTSLTRFLTPDGLPRTKDEIFTMQHKVLAVTVAREDDQYVYWEDNGKMDKKDLAVIIYSNGDPKIFCPMAQAAMVLGASHDTPLNLSPGADAVASDNKPAPAPPIPPVTRPAATQTGDSPPPADPAGNRPALPGRSTGDDSVARAKVDSLLGGHHISREEFADKCQQKTKLFTDYLAILCKKNSPNEELNKATDQAIALFVSEDATVEVSSNNRNTINRYKIRTYLTRLKLVPYDRIEVQWVNVQYVDDLKLGPDGNLHGTVSFEQVFRAYKDNQLVYSDVTIKTANILLKMYKVNAEGSTGRTWDVLLSDVGVNATKTL
jgi:hypothetical protein